MTNKNNPCRSPLVGSPFGFIRRKRKTQKQETQLKCIPCLSLQQVKHTSTRTSKGVVRAVFARLCQSAKDTTCAAHLCPGSRSTPRTYPKFPRLRLGRTGPWQVGKWGSPRPGQVDPPRTLPGKVEALCQRLSHRTLGRPKSQNTSIRREMPTRWESLSPTKK